MVSINKNFLKKLAKIVVFTLSLYTIFFLASSVNEYFQSYKEKELLTNQLQFKRDETALVKDKITALKDRTKIIQESYIKEDEIKNKITEIFDRVSLVDYQLKLVDVRNECIDRHILVARLYANSEDGYKFGEGIFNFLGENIRSEQDENLYFINYISRIRR